MPIAIEARLLQGEPFAAAARSADAVAVLVWPDSDVEGPVLGPGSGELSDLSGLDLSAVVAMEESRATAGEVITFPIASSRRTVRGLLVGVGDRSPAAYRRAGAALARKQGAADAVVCFPEEPAGSDFTDTPPEQMLRAFVEGLMLGSYSFSVAGSHARDTPATQSPVHKVHIAEGGDGVGSTSGASALRVAESTARAVALARDLVNTPSSTKSPQWLAEQAQRIAGSAGLGLRVRGEDELRVEGFGGILAVGSGSASPPRLIELSYEPENPQGHVVLVGKGITFDSGGLSLKPNENMKLMKTDMAGGGVVMGVLSALRELGVRSRVTGLVAAAENMPSGSAQRPGDVITHYGGRTSAVLNTDAEGRLVLADALAYASGRLAPDALVDLATLTGAATVALGRTHGALYATDEVLAAELLDAGALSGDRLWRMPLVQDYRPALDSDVADLAHIPPSHSDRGAGSVMAALFLSAFAGTDRWAHLDIAGPSRATSNEHEITKGGTGFGVRALLRWLAG